MSFGVGLPFASPFQRPVSAAAPSSVSVANGAVAARDPARPEGSQATQNVATLRADAVRAGDETSATRLNDSKRPGDEPRKPGEIIADERKPGETEKKSDKPTAGGEELSEEEENQVRELKQRDTEVRQHEQAHAAVGGPYAGSPQYEFTTGPDGKKYATSGEVPIDASPERTPEQTIRKAEIVIRAATAPAEPSSQDRQVAQQAQRLRTEAQAELRKQKQAQRDKIGGAEKAGDQGASSSASDGLAGALQVAAAAYEQTASAIFGGTVGSGGLFGDGVIA
ncbi:hypothetical protein HPQ64_06170 [Rhizobiales bacterium]|uniref:putative metalloprotease CJM1_0395 family protein n=1 Tax=Hongsoonwoonella zoysiae TaxID=2821844 RepID=UPI0015606EFE|nr:putative metalloprotease CJM1_0395 family protein [Hongsoonwoonella zoysiae]NRG17266.1 hypothetical protein [Hongsoonwoonella zoysiae]